MKQKIIQFGGQQRRTAPDRAWAKAASGKRRKRRRTGRHTLHYILILLVAAAILAILSLTVFFRIEKLSVAGTTKYAAQEIIDQSGIKVGDNLFRVSEDKVSKQLVEKFPYVEAVTLKRTFPPSLTIQITQAKPLGAVDTPTGFLIIGRSGRVLEIGAQTLPEDMTVVSGMYLYNPQVGKVLGEGYKKDEQAEAEKEQEAFKMLTYLVDAVAQTSFERITMVDFSDRLNMMLIYDNRIMIELGSELNLSYKLKFAKRVITDELEPSFEGILDVSIEKEVWAKPADVAAELEKRRTAAAAQTNPDKKPLDSQNPETVTESASSSSSTASGESSSSKATSSYNELEVIPNSAQSSAPVSSS
ncbi:FtsQ-type POTRA domain-containing protein [Oscillospiraceae bacterium PP1C4]